MSESSPEPSETPADRQSRIHKEFRVAFEATPDGEQFPQIENYLERVPDNEQPNLLVKLIDIDHCYRWRAGGLPTLQGYLKRFPRFADAVNEGFLAPLGREELPFGLIRKLGEGGIGRAFLAREHSLTGSREIAVKVLREEVFEDRGRQDKERMVARFRQEIATAAKIRHPNTVSVHYAGRFSKDAPFYVAMEYVPGETLADLIRKKRIEPIQAARLLRTIAGAVHALHTEVRDCALIHRDLKPSNIFLDEKGTPYVADFGLAATAVQLHFNDPHAGLGGTPAYMSPEQVRAWKDRPGGFVDRRSDIWSLGVIFYEMLTGLKPFQGEGEDLIWDIQNRPLTFPEDFDVPPKLGKIICKCLAKDPEDRFGTAEELRTHLSRWLHTMTGPDEVRSIPYPPSDFFTGRTSHVARCRELLLSKGRVALCGMAGVGKTQVALAYAQEYQDEYRYVFWLNAANDQSLSIDFVGIAGLLDLSEKTDPNHPRVVQVVKRWLDRHDGWLLIFDNANDLSMVRDSVPRSGRGHILLTTWDPMVGGFAPKVNVLPLEPEAGAFLLLRRAGILRDGDSLDDATEEDRAAAIAITTEVEGLPLALDQAGAYIEATDTLPTEYLELYRQHGAEFRRDESGKWSRDYPHTVATTWSMAFAELHERTPAAGDFLRFASVLLPKGIPEALILAARPHVHGGLAHALNHALGFNALIHLAKRLSLLIRDPATQLIHIHGLIQQVRLDSMTDDELANWRRVALCAAHDAFPAFPSVLPITDETRAACLQLLAHSWHVLSTSDDSTLVSLGPLLATEIVDRVGLFAESFLSLDIAERCYRRGLTVLRLAHECNSTGDETQPYGYMRYRRVYVSTRLALDRVLRSVTTHTSERETLLKETLSSCQEVDDDQHCEVLIALSSLYRDSGNTSLAREHLERASRLSAASDATIAWQLLYGRALCDLWDGNTEAAKKLWLVLLSQYRDSIFGCATSPEDKLMVANVCMRLSELAFTESDWAQAFHYGRLAMDLRLDVLGENHLTCAQTFHHVGLVAMRLGASAGYNPEAVVFAERFFGDAADIFRASLGSDNARYHECMRGQIGCMALQGLFREAEKILGQLVCDAGPENGICDRARRDIETAKMSRANPHRQSRARDRKLVERKKSHRNDPCPCGSGKKFKKCCGKASPDDTKLM